MAKNNSSLTKTKVLYIVESFSTGVYAIVRDVACNLDKDKFEVLIIHSLRDDSPKTIDQDFIQSNITLKYVPMGTKKDYFKAIKAIKEITKEYKPDAIHLHSSKAGFLGRLAIKGQCENVLYSPHGLSFLRTDVNKLFRFIFFQLEYWINKYVPSKIISVSEGENQHALKITKNSIVINNFIDTSAFVEKVEEGEQIVTCGRISPQKNPTLFNEIARALPKEQFLWIGDGPLKETLDSPNINITGLLSRQKAVDNVKKASVYLQTSLWEGMPVSILEAMAASKVVVATNVVGNRDLIEDQKTGYLGSPDDVDFFVETLTKLRKDGNLRKKIGDNAKSYIMKNHDLKRAISLYENNYLNK
jgi:glycosyltransferase involved in cell wall biosynthesis